MKYVNSAFFLVLACNELYLYSMNMGSHYVAAAALVAAFFAIRIKVNA